MGLAGSSADGPGALELLLREALAPREKERVFLSWPFAALPNLLLAG